jgi:hypothetical protein
MLQFFRWAELQGSQVMKRFIMLLGVLLLAGATCIPAMGRDPKWDSKRNNGDQHGWIDETPQKANPPYWYRYGFHKYGYPLYSNAAGPALPWVGYYAPYGYNGGPYQYYNGHLRSYGY